MFIHFIFYFLIYFILFFIFFLNLKQESGIMVWAIERQHMHLRIGQRHSDRSRGSQPLRSNASGSRGLADGRHR